MFRKFSVCFALLCFLTLLCFALLLEKKVQKQSLLCLALLWVLQAKWHPWSIYTNISPTNATWGGGIFEDFLGRPSGGIKRPKSQPKNPHHLTLSARTPSNCGGQDPQIFQNLKFVPPSYGRILALFRVLYRQTVVLLRGVCSHKLCPRDHIKHR